MICSFQLKIFFVMPLRSHPMTRFNILPLFSRSGSSPITCFLISYFLDIILTRNSTTDRSPPIVMSSPCTVATICLPVLQPCHTHGHALPLVNLRSLSVDASSSSQFSAASRVPYKLYYKSSGGSWANTLLRVGAWKYAPSHVNWCHNLSSTFNCGDLRQQHYFQRRQWERHRV